jgi:hypothetical protein
MKWQISFGTMQRVANRQVRPALLELERVVAGVVPERLHGVRTLEGFPGLHLVEPPLMSNLQISLLPTSPPQKLPAPLA